MQSTSDLFKLVQLSIGTPENGAVNFNALQKLLHLIVEKLDFLPQEAVILKHAFPETKQIEEKNEQPMKIAVEIGKDSLGLGQVGHRGSLPSPKDMLQLVKKQTTLADLVNNINLVKKVEANKEAVEMVSFVELDY